MTNNHDVSTTLYYYNDPGGGSPPMPVVVGRNKVTNERPMIPCPMVVHDITGEEQKYKLDSHGFQLCRHKSSESTFQDEERIKTHYYAELQQLLKDITGASRVYIFEHMVRNGPSNWHKLGDNNTKKRGPLRRVHVDQSYHGAELILGRHLPEEAEQLKQRRWQIINIWRPIKTIRQDPLAIADASSVSDEDLVAASILYVHSGHKAETWTIRHNPAHRWYFKYLQEPDEALLFKCFDSSTDVARRAPHTAFENPGFGPREDLRESIEARALVFY